MRMITPSSGAPPRSRSAVIEEEGGGGGGGVGCSNRSAFFRYCFDLETAAKDFLEVSFLVLRSTNLGPTPIAFMVPQMWAVDANAIS